MVLIFGDFQRRLAHMKQGDATPQALALWNSVVRLKPGDFFQASRITKAWPQHWGR
jgi:hypothetical protein